MTPVYSIHTLGHKKHRPNIKVAAHKKHHVKPPPPLCTVLGLLTSRLEHTTLQQLMFFPSPYFPTKKSTTCFSCPAAAKAHRTGPVKTSWPPDPQWEKLKWGGNEECLQGRSIKN